MKKITALISAFLLMSNSTFAFTFPTPNWTKLLNEKTKMVTETDFEMYAEAEPYSAPYYGAKFEPQGGVYIGMIAETSEKFTPISGYLTYIDGMNQNDLYWPANTKIQNENVIATIGWTITDMGAVDYDHVRSVLNRLNDYNKPMFIRFANEMNVSPIGNDPDLYKEVFRNVANMVHEYPNFAVVWSPNDLGGLDRPFDYYYPGDEYVDWVGVSSYMKKYFQGQQNTQRKDTIYFMTGDYAWATNAVKPIVEFMQKNNINKPLMLSECGVATNNNFGEDMEAWATPRFRNLLYNLIMKYPQIKMINYFNTHRVYEVEKYDISNYGYAVDIFNEARQSGAYITSYGAAPEFTFRSAQVSGEIRVDNGIANLYTLAHFPDYADATVHYTLDGTWYHMSSQRPYKCALDISNLADGAHTMQIEAYNQKRTYTFYKNGQRIGIGMDPGPSEPIVQEPINNEVSITVNGEQLWCDVPPFIDNERTLVPVRAIFETLGAVVEWEPISQMVLATKGDLEITLKIGNNEMVVGYETRMLDVPAQIVDGRTFVPARAVSEALGCSVEWNPETKTVIITQ